jgi:uncharacterized membrane protein
MYVPNHLMSSIPLFSAYLIWFAMLAQAWQWAPWAQLKIHGLLNVYFVAVAMLIVLWCFEASATPGLGFRFLGLTVFTLMFGWSLGVIGASLASLGIAVQTGILDAVPINALLLGILPVSVSYGIYYGVHHYLPRHLFVYIFLCAFLGSIIAAGVAVVVLASTLILINAYSLERIVQEYFPFLPLYLFPEGLLNGMLTTIFIGVRPQWLKTFDDDSYLKPW